MKKDMIKLTGLWREKDQEGKTYLAGSLNAISKIVILSNTYKKEGDTSPDYFLYLTQVEKKPANANKKDPI